MADIRLLFPHDYLSAADLREQDVSFTISKVIVDDLKTDRGSEKKPVVMFTELDRRRSQGQSIPYKWVLNRTCAKVLAKLYGHETDNWIGKRITLYPTTCQAFGETVSCIRVRPTAPPPKRNSRQQPPPQPEPEPEPEPGAFDEPDLAGAEVF